jgi:hypothetical protein
MYMAFDILLHLLLIMHSTPWQLAGCNRDVTMCFLVRVEHVAGYRSVAATGGATRSNYAMKHRTPQQVLGA